MATTPEQTETTGLVTQATPPPVAEVREDQQSTFEAQDPTETGEGSTYEGVSQADILAEQQKGLVSMLEEDNPYMQMARAQGARQAEARGLGGSSLRGRASQGAAIQSAMPLVQQASQQASSERQAAQQFTAQSAVEAANRRLSEMQQQYDLAAKANDSAAMRQLESEMAQETNELAKWQTQASIESQEKQQQQDIAYQKEAAAVEQQFQKDMQGIDIDYKRWLEDTTFKHQGILQGNQQAANTYSDFTAASAQVLNNPDTTAKQKKASIASLKEALEGSLQVISKTANIDLNSLLPAYMNNVWSGSNDMFAPEDTRTPLEVYRDENPNPKTYTDKEGNEQMAPSSTAFEVPGGGVPGGGSLDFSGIPSGWGNIDWSKINY
ncbi:MAG: hypothetical protein MJK15_00875 [Colwellia sp.]|nr:hypothetical protein [Colwellia sp.]